VLVPPAALSEIVMLLAVDSSPAITKIRSPSWTAMALLVSVPPPLASPSMRV